MALSVGKTCGAQRSARARAGREAAILGRGCAGGNTAGTTG